MTDLEKENNEKDEKKYPKIPDVLEERIKHEIGRIISAINDPVFIGLNESARIKAAIQPDKSQRIQLGDYLLVYDFLRGETISVRIIGHSTQTIDEKRTTDQLFKLNTPSGYEQFTNKRYDFLRTPHIIHLDPMKIVKFPNNRMITSSSVNFAPSESAAVFEPIDTEIKEIIGLVDKGVNFGVLARENEIQTFTSSESKEKYLIPVKISLDTLTRHLSINGSTGSGKTVILKYLIHEFSQQNIPILLTDTQGDFISQLFKNRLTDKQQEFVNKNKSETQMLTSALGFSYNKIGIQKEKIKVYYLPLMEKDTFIKDCEKNGIKTQALQLSSDLIDSWGTLAIVMPNLNDVQYQGLELIFLRYLDVLKEEKQIFKLEKFITWIERNQETIHEEHRVHHGTLRVILRNLELLLKKNIFDRVEEGGTEYKELMKEGQITILYLPSDNSDVLGVRPIVQLLIYNLILKHRSDSTFQRVIIIDEAQEVIPNENEAPSKSVARELAKKFQILATQGRKFNISLIVASQEPRKINRTVFSQCSSRIFLKLPSKDVEYLKFEIPSECREAIVRLKTGSGLIQTPDIEVGEVWVRFPIPPIYHEKPNLTKEKISNDLSQNLPHSRPEDSRQKSIWKDEE